MFTKKKSKKKQNNQSDSQRKSFIIAIIAIITIVILVTHTTKNVPVDEELGTLSKEQSLVGEAARGSKNPSSVIVNELKILLPGMSLEEILAKTNVFEIEEHFAESNGELTYNQNIFRDKLQQSKRLRKRSDDRKELEEVYSDFSKVIDEDLSHLSDKELKEFALIIATDVNAIKEEQREDYHNNYRVYSVTAEEKYIESLSKSLFGLEKYTADRINLLDGILKWQRWSEEEEEDKPGILPRRGGGGTDTPPEGRSTSPGALGGSIRDCASFLAGTGKSGDNVGGGNPSSIGTTLEPGGNVVPGQGGMLDYSKPDSGLTNICVEAILEIPGGISDPVSQEESPGLDIKDYSVLDKDPLEVEKSMKEAKDFEKKMEQDPALEDSEMEQYFDDQKQGEIELTPVPGDSDEMPTSTSETLEEMAKTVIPVIEFFKDLADGKLKGDVPVGNSKAGLEISNERVMVTFGYIPAPESENIDADDPCNDYLLCIMTMMKEIQNKKEKEKDCPGSLDKQEEGIAIVKQSSNDCGGDLKSAIPYLGLFPGFIDPLPEQKKAQASTPTDYTTFLVIEPKESETSN